MTDFVPMKPQRYMYEEWSNRPYSFAEKIVAFGNYVFSVIKGPESIQEREITEVKTIATIWDDREGFKITENLVKESMYAHRPSNIYNYSIQCSILPKDFQTSKTATAHELRVNLYVYQEEKGSE